MNILIIDDDRGCLESLGSLLEPRGTQYQLFTNPMKAIAALARGHFDMILTDLKMPEMNGLNVLSLCREMVPGIRVLILTGLDNEKSFNAAYDQGVYACFRKPLNVKRFMEVLCQIEQEIALATSKKLEKE